MVCGQELSFASRRPLHGLYHGQCDFGWMRKFGRNCGPLENDPDIQENVATHFVNLHDRTYR